MATQAIDRKKFKHALKTEKRKAPELVNRSNKRQLKQLADFKEKKTARFYFWQWEGSDYRY